MNRLRKIGSRALLRKTASKDTLDKMGPSKIPNEGSRPSARRVFDSAPSRYPVLCGTSHQGFGLRKPSSQRTASDRFPSRVRATPQDDSSYYDSRADRVYTGPSPAAVVDSTAKPRGLRRRGAVRIASSSPPPERRSTVCTEEEHAKEAQPSKLTRQDSFACVKRKPVPSGAVNAAQQAKSLARAKAYFGLSAEEQLSLSTIEEDSEEETEQPVWRAGPERRVKIVPPRKDYQEMSAEICWVTD